MTEIIGRGAEAIIYKKKDTVTKDRISKSYRHTIIDNNLRKFRTRREAKILEKLRQINFPGPALINSCDKSMKIEMEFIDGNKVRDILEQNHIIYSEEIGKLLGILHENGIIHADLTTSNMILKDKIHFIDFGLSFFSDKVEDKAVDLHLLDRALESKHYKIHKQCMNAILKGYKQTYKNHKEVINRLAKVQERGRNKSKH